MTVFVCINTNGQVGYATSRSSQIKMPRNGSRKNDPAFDSRKAVLPVFEQPNCLLFYPVQYEGRGNLARHFYSGATPDQQAIPAVRYLMSKEGGEVRRRVLLGTDYIYPRTDIERLSHGRGCVRGKT